MISPLQTCKTAIRLATVTLLLTAPAFAAGISATATFSATADPSKAGVYDYTMTLNNTGTTTIGTFWFAWVPGAGFLPDAATNVSSPAGWGDVLTNAGDAIQWTSTTSLLAPGASLSGFVFDSVDSPAKLLANYTGTGAGAGDPITTSFVYIGAPLKDPGFQLVVAQTPEPNSLLLLVTGLLGGAGTYYRRLRLMQTA